MRARVRSAAARFRSLECLGLLVAVLAAPPALPAQGTLVMDQVCGTDGLVVEGVPAHEAALGQSFMPALSGISFVQFQAVVYPGGGSATTRVYLREEGPAGLLLGATDPLLITDNALAVRTWLFPDLVALTPGQTYYLGLETELINPGTVGMSVSYLFGWPYDRGSLYANGVLSPNADLWFRTGVAVPEPGAWALFALGLVSWRAWRFWTSGKGR